MLSTKLLLSVLSNSQISDLHRFFFALCADHNNCVTRLRLQAILAKFAEITMFMHEDVHCGRHLVNPSIEDCFINVTMLLILIIMSKAFFVFSLLV